MTRKPGNSWRCPVCHNFVYDVMAKACNSCTDRELADESAVTPLVEPIEDIPPQDVVNDAAEKMANEMSVQELSDALSAHEASTATVRKNETKYKTFNIVEKDPRVVKVFSEDADGFWMWLHPGWTADPRGAHDIHEMTVTVTMEAYKRIVPCTCDECKARIDDVPSTPAVEEF